MCPSEGYRPHPGCFADTECIARSPAKLTLNFGHRQEEIDLGEPDARDGLFDNGEIGAYAGNIYLYVDGREYGSLFIYHDDQGPVIELGQFDETADEWVTRAALRALPAHVAQPLESAGA